MSEEKKCIIAFSMVFTSNGAPDLFNTTILNILEEQCRPIIDNAIRGLAMEGYTVMLADQNQTMEFMGKLVDEHREKVNDATSRRSNYHEGSGTAQ